MLSVHGAGAEIIVGFDKKCQESQFAICYVNGNRCNTVEYTMLCIDLSLAFLPRYIRVQAKPEH